jgi:hypothetical protein
MRGTGAAWAAVGSWVVAVVAGLGADPARAQLVAERITRANAAERLFGGSDADGGVGDWYLSNGVLEAIVDEAGPQEDLPAGVEPPAKQSEAGVSGGTLLDLARVGADNDQLSHLFTVGGLSAANFIAYDTVEALVAGGAATITARGGLRGFEGLAPEELPVVTEYRLEAGAAYLVLHSTVRNEGEATAPFLGGFLDVAPWTTRAIVPFSPLPGRGFRHRALDLATPQAALERPVYSIGPGSVVPADGIMDPETGARAGEVSYGLVGVRASFDADGEGPGAPVVSSVNRLFGVSGVQASALGNVPVAGGLLPGQVLTYERRVYVGGRNDVASAANPILAELAPRLGFATGTLYGDVSAPGARGVAASGIATRTGGPPIAGILDGSPVTQFRTDAGGTFAGVVVPEGTYDVELRAVERDPVVVRGVVVAPGADARVAVPALGALGALELEARVVGLPRAPVKITIVGRDGTPDPQLAKDFEALEERTGLPDLDLRPETFGGALAQARWVTLPHGAGRVELRPGSYEVFASRGPEYCVASARIAVEPGASRRAALVLRRAFRTPGALSADFHIHSARSLDSSAGPEGRVASFAAEGVEVMVSTDHDFVLDYRPVIAELGLGRFVASIVGNEVTTTVPNPPAFPEAVGHLNAWPLEVDPHARKDGAIEDEGVAPNFLLSRLRRAGAEVIQYNHPRAGTRGLGAIGFFNDIGCNRCAADVDRRCAGDADCPGGGAGACTCVGYQPGRPLEAPPNDVLLDDDVTGASGVANPDGLRNIDFDVMEVANGLDVAQLLQTRADWFSLLNQAFGPTARGPVPFLPGTGVSDSHRNALESAGYFRTYVLGAGDHPARLDPRAFDESVLAGRMIATTGPWLEVELRDGKGRRAGVGELMAKPRKGLALHLRVLASPWVPVDEVRVIQNGVVTRAFDAASEPALRPGPALRTSQRRDEVVRFDAEIPLALARDGWIAVEAGARLDPSPAPDPFADALVPGWISWAFTNPIFVDLRGDGFDPPGLTAAADPGPPREVAHPAPRSAKARASHRDPLPLHRLRIAPGAVPELRGRKR